MRLKLTTFRKSLFMLSAAAVLTSGCGNDAAKDGEELPEVDSTQTTIVNINGEIFSIPSPIQTAFLIKNSGANYQKEILNTPSKSSQYTTNFAKALNLGIYGADLGYVTMYDQTQDAIGFMNSAKKLAGDLNITGAFDNATLERNDISGLVLAGGWIESLYFATNVYKVKQDEFVKRRIAEQKSSLQSLIKLLTQYYSQPEYT